MNMPGASPREAGEDTRCTYVNIDVKTPDSSSEAVDVNFLTDTNVYYNLPPPLPSAHSRGTSLPRRHPPTHQHFNRAYWSCPASPKLPPSAVVPRKDNIPCTTTEMTGKDVPSPPIQPRAPEPKNKVSHTRSFDLDHLYQNLVRVASKPRSNSFSIDLPWRRKKKTQDTTPDIKEDSGEDWAARMLHDNEEINYKPNLLQTSSPRSIPDVHSNLTTCSRSSSSSSTSGSSESGGVAEECSAEVCPGVTYLRETTRKCTDVRDEDLNSWYHTAATLPLRASKDTSRGSLQSLQQRQALDVNANLDEWLRKERWLEKKRNSHNIRLAGENVEVDIAILYASDGEKWKCYLYNVFTQLAPKEEGFRGIRVEVKNVQEIEDDIGRLQAVQLKGAKLQIVILSPCFLAHIAKPGRSEIGQLFKPEKVLALLLGVDDSQFTMAHRSALYSYNDWHRLRVRNMDLTFVYEVLFEGISILKSCELFSQYQDERNAEFKITPRKVNMVHQLLYIMMDKPVKSKNSVEVLIEGLNKYTSIKKFHLRNPYTIDFRMPEEFLRGSSLICVTVLVDKKRIGSRQLKCESSMDTLKTILTNVSNPTEFMCQALNINPTSDELDQKLADTVRFHLPPHRLGESNVQNRDGYKFPTWIHFSAYYGLERLIWALLEIPGGEAALNTTNCHGHTPSVLAYQKHFSTLAQKLEDAALVSSLAAKVGYMPEIRRAISMHGEAQGCEEMYNSPPPPRPLVSYQMYGYDSLPAPREVSSNTLVASPVRLEVSENLMTPSCSPPLSPALSGSEQHVPSPDIPSPLSPATRLHTSSSTTQQADYTNSVKDDRYLDMNVSSECQKEKEYVLEYSADVYTLVTAWREKTNIKTFVEKNQDKIVEVKSKLDSSKGKDPTDLAKDSTEIEMGAMSLPQGETAEPAEITAPDVIRRKSVVEQFFDLLRRRRKQPHPLDLEGTLSKSDLPPNDYTNDPTHISMKDKSENYNESSRVISNTSVNTSKSHPQLEMREDTQQNDIHSSGKTTVERLPQPPPRIEASNIYLQAEDINSPSLHEIKIHQEMIKSASISDLGKSCLPTSSAKYLNLPKNFATHTKKQDEDYSIYSTVN